MPDQPLSGQQIAEINRRANKALQDAVDKVDLRRVAMQFAVQCNLPVGGGDVVKLAEAIHDFLTAPAADVKVTLE